MILGLLALSTPACVWAGPDEMVLLSDEELSQVRAGDLDIEVLGDTVTFIEGNQARSVSFNIGDRAFSRAEGVFTTLMAVNSAVDLSVVVNVYLGQSRSGNQ